MKRRPLRVGGFGFYAMCIFLSTIALQALTTPSPAPSFLSRLNPIESFLWSHESSDISALDLRLRNLSVHRVRYVEAEDEDQVTDARAILTGVRKTLTEFLTTRRSAEVSSVVVTWEDHPLAAHARANDARLEGDARDSTLDSFSYEVQIWVTGWGLDSLWNPANKRVITWDPFLVLTDLPLEYELGFRTDGPWSEVVMLSPTRDDELEAIVTSLAGNKPLLVLLAVCIGSGCLVPSRRSSSENDAVVEAADGLETDSGKTLHELEHEIRDLRQELADSEDEVRQLMLFSGYGIETLEPHELDQLERELKHTLKRIHLLKRHGATPEPEMSDNMKSQPPVDESTSKGTVYLVGAGPGDPELLTLKARRLLASATVAVVDDLVGTEVYALIPKDCEIVYVGKRGGKKDSAKQVDIDAILVDKCRDGHIVVRLKGGDPMVFGRVHSEIRTLVRAQCKFEVVPGISSALAMPAIANIPVTHKTLSTNFVVISGHKPAEMDFALLAKVETIVLLMATRTIGSICESLVENGKEKDTPVALIHSGTNPDQVLLMGTLEDIAMKMEGKKYSPAIIVIGQVAKYGHLQAYLDESDDEPINTDV
ncbi:Tetrapyrrole (Corrin/Porphyrin) Methylase [Phytophthora palmivora]|uniref:uroporphyrinogen-III C-methyltransferase n=1 Tax=Phytophthora palmivora TaxID=4796 RepID=A0A2P4WZA3_9STRA|nr:Tetrapyrrole (Corrin/Porphyrin) Methylase [Phytophthora palmivora]